MDPFVVIRMICDHDTIERINVRPTMTQFWLLNASDMNRMEGSRMSIQKNIRSVIFVVPGLSASAFFAVFGSPLRTAVFLGVVRPPFLAPFA